jgi:hypothetical protein
MSPLEFNIKTENSSNINEQIKVGTIKRRGRDALDSLAGSDADAFDIFFPEKATVDEKLLLICLTLMLDYIFFEGNDDTKNRRGGFGFGGFL